MIVLTVPVRAEANEFSRRMSGIFRAVNRRVLGRSAFAQNSVGNSFVLGRARRKTGTINIELNAPQSRAKEHFCWRQVRDFVSRQREIVTSFSTRTAVSPSHALLHRRPIPLRTTSPRKRVLILCM